MNTYLKNCTINMHVFLSDEILRLKSPYFRNSII